MLSYLPEWRKGRDYRTVYSVATGRRARLIHGWTMCGSAIRCAGPCCGQVFVFEIDSDDMPSFSPIRASVRSLDYWTCRAARSSCFGEEDVLRAIFVEYAI